MSKLVSLSVRFALLVSASIPLAAQQNVGISAYSTSSPTRAPIYCGFDCNDPANTGTGTAQTGSAIYVTLRGDIGLPAALAIGLGPTIAPCPAFVIGGLHNSLQIAPGNLLVTVGVPPLGRTNTFCNATGYDVAISGTLVVPTVALGLVLSFQGVVFDNGQPAFTRPVDLTIS